MELRRTSPGLIWLTGALILIMLGFGIANLTGLAYAPGDDEWRTFVGVFSIVNAQFLLAGLVLTGYRSRLGTALLSLAALFAFFSFAPVPGVFQIHAIAIVFLAIRRARRLSRADQLAAV